MARRLWILVGLVASAVGQGEWPRICFDETAETQLPVRGPVRVEPILEFDGVSLNRCLAACARTEDCESVVYVEDRELCWLHDTTTQRAGSKPCVGVNYYQIRRPCELVVEQEIPCPDEEAPAFIRRLGFTLAGADAAVTLPGLDNPFDCRVLCEGNIDAEGEPFPCAAFVFNEASGECQLFSDGAAPFGRSVAVEDVESDVYQKLCLGQDELACEGAELEWEPGFVLVGFAGDVLEDLSFRECQAACAQSTDLRCRLAIYYFDDRQCILNEETKETQPELWSEEEPAFPEHAVHVYCPDLDALEGPFRQRSRLASALKASTKTSPATSLRLRGSGGRGGQGGPPAPPPLLSADLYGEWSRWSRCLAGQRFRRRRCIVGAARRACDPHGAHQRRLCGPSLSPHFAKLRNLVQL